MNPSAPSHSIKRPWLHWGLLAVAFTGYFAYALLQGDKTVFVPGAMTSAHHQIEMACATCHAKPFKGGPVLQDACIRCHGNDLQAANDSHPMSKFTDPRNAALLEKLDARLCVTCHREHAPDITGPMAVTVPGDFCFHCHQDVAKDRPSHAGMDFKTCATGGCHNFHDNQSLYEDFLDKHLHESKVKAGAEVPVRDQDDLLRAIATLPVTPLTLTDQDAPAEFHALPAVDHEWSTTAHARAGVNCSACHQVKEPGTTRSVWREKPGHEVCITCHKTEGDGFLAGKHGMRLAAGLSPMTPGMARLPMKASARDKTLGCTSCHDAHNFDIRKAAVEACLNCHDDAHSRAYKDSPHFGLWHAELAGKAPAGSGVSCATCHMPREVHRMQGVSVALAQHNQSLNLRPNEKMVRSVCMNCHGLGFSLDALADAKLVEKNFSGNPSIHVRSLDMAEARLTSRNKPQKEENATRK